MKRVLILSLLSTILGVSGQTLVNNWTKQELSDPFVDEQQIVLAIAENGERYEGEGPFFAVICKANVADVIYFNVNRSLFSGETRDFDYRVNGDEIKTAEAWLEDGFVSLRTGEDDFARFKEDTLVDGAEVAFATVSSSGERVVTVFELTGLDSALADAGCVR